jgi:hypothetical protein
VSDLGAERKCWHDALPAAIGGNAENICSSRAFLRLTNSVMQRIETIVALFLSWLAAKP